MEHDNYGFAFPEGWGIFECDDGLLRIQKLDDPESLGLEPNPLIDTDAGALSYVRLRAQQGSLLHQNALDLHLHWGEDCSDFKPIPSYTCGETP